MHMIHNEYLIYAQYDNVQYACIIYMLIPTVCTYRTYYRAKCNFLNRFKIREFTTFETKVYSLKGVENISTLIESNDPVRVPGADSIFF